MQEEAAEKIDNLIIPVAVNHKLGQNYTAIYGYKSVFLLHLLKYLVTHAGLEPMN